MQEDQTAVAKSDYDYLLSLYSLAHDEYKILTFTHDFEILQELNTKVSTWLEKVMDLDENPVIE
jgi:hypothetical protein